MASLVSKSKYMTKKQIEVAAALIKQDGKYLITQRLPDSHLGLYWEFPGGKRKPEESLEDCLKREILEELGLIIGVGNLVNACEHEYEDRVIKLFFYEGKILAGTPAPIECHDFKWLSPEDMKTADFPPADIEVIQILQRKD
jgi:mutator protein MutT